MKFLILCIAVTLAACATTPPIDTTGTDTSLTPDKALNGIQAAQGRRVAWGGMIINTRNLKDVTEIEVLGYPLSSDGKPNRSAPAQHRFLLVHDGYLETSDYRSGRLVSAAGTIQGIRNGKVGEAPYAYPTLHADQLYLWPNEEPRQSPNVNFGVGIGVIFGR